MRVVFYTTWPEHDLRREIRLRQLLAPFGIDFMLVRVLRAESSGPSDSEEGIWICRSDEGSPVGPAAQSGDFEEFLRNMGPDWVISYGTKNKILYGLRSHLHARLASVIGGGYRDRMIGGLDLVLAETGDQIRQLTKRAPLLPSMILPKLVPNHFFTEGRVNRDIDVLGVGRHTEGKNYASLIPLFGNGIKVVLAGDGGQTERLRQASGGLTEVEIVGQLSEIEVSALARRSRVLAHPSSADGLPRAICEAMAAGCVPIYVRSTVRTRLLESGNSIAVDTVDNLREAVLAALENPESTQDRSSAAVEVARREWSDAALSDSAAVLAGALKARSLRRLASGFHDRRRHRERYS